MAEFPKRSLSFYLFMSFSRRFQVYNNKKYNHEKFYKAIARFVKQKQRDIKDFKINDNEREPLVNFSNIIAQGRAAVDRDGYSRDITIVHEPEQPWRLLNAFESLYKCLLIIHEGDVPSSMKILKEVCISTLPLNRLKVIETLASKDGIVTLDQLVTSTGYPRSTCRHILEDMKAQKMVIDQYRLVPEFSSLWRKAIL